MPIMPIEISGVALGTIKKISKYTTRKISPVKAPPINLVLVLTPSLEEHVGQVISPKYSP